VTIPAQHEISLRSYEVKTTIVSAKGTMPEQTILEYYLAIDNDRSRRLDERLESLQHTVMLSLIQATAKERRLNKSLFAFPTPGNWYLMVEDTRPAKNDPTFESYLEFWKMIEESEIVYWFDDPFPLEASGYFGPVFGENWDRIPLILKHIMKALAPAGNEYVLIEYRPVTGTVTIMYHPSLSANKDFYEKKFKMLTEYFDKMK
jgi:hypothetical protein